MGQYQPPELRKAQREDIPEMQQLFANTIVNVCKDDYTSEQMNAWLSGIRNEKRWNDLVDQQFCVVAQLEKIVGFGSLAGGSYIDFLYTHKDYLGQGVAGLLIAELLAEAVRQGAVEVSAHVSITARPFFERHGFSVVKGNIRTFRGVEINNFVMSRHVTSPT